jgi:serine/threonine protein kinase
MLPEETVLGHYRLLQPIGSGGMGEVYLAEDTRITRRVAVKVIRSELSLYPNAPEVQEARRLFQREMKAIAALDHPNILPLIDFGEQTLSGGIYTYLVMPYRPEGSLADWLRTRNHPPLLPAEVIHLILQAAEALQHAHDHQIIHLDVKASNFLVHTRQGNNQLPDLLLADFGIARFNTTVSTVSQSIRGTPAAMAPEQWMSQPVAASDQYALAVMAYQLLTGTMPFQGSIHQMMYKHIQEPPPPPSTHNAHLSPALDAVLLRAMAKKPEERFPSVQAFATALRNVQDDIPSTEHIAPAPTSTATLEDAISTALISFDAELPASSPPTKPVVSRTRGKRPSRRQGIFSVTIICALIVAVVTASAFILTATSPQTYRFVYTSQPTSSTMPAVKAGSTPTNRIPYGKLLYTTSSPGEFCATVGEKWSNYNQPQIQCSATGATISNPNSTSPNLVGTILTALPAGTYPSDYVIEAQIQRLNTSSNYGIYFRNQPGSEQGVYTFLVHPYNRWDAYIYSNTNGNQLSLASGKIPVGKIPVEKNSLLTLTVVAAGADFTFYINGQFEGSIHNTVYDTGSVGIAVDAGGKIGVKSFSLYALGTG